jgi:hypothetical protein
MPIEINVNWRNVLTGQCAINKQAMNNQHIVNKQIVRIKIQTLVS